MSFYYLGYGAGAYYSIMYLSSRTTKENRRYQM